MWTVKLKNTRNQIRKTHWMGSVARWNTTEVHVYESIYMSLQKIKLCWRRTEQLVTTKGEGWGRGPADDGATLGPLCVAAVRLIYPCIESTALPKHTRFFCVESTALPKHTRFFCNVTWKIQIKQDTMNKKRRLGEGGTILENVSI